LFDGCAGPSESPEVPVDTPPAEVVSTDGPADDAGRADAPPEERAVIAAEVADFRAQCLAGCAEKMLEEARCLAGLRFLEGVSLCQ